MWTYARGMAKKTGSKDRPWTPDKVRDLVWEAFQRDMEAEDPTGLPGWINARARELTGSGVPEEWLQGGKRARNKLSWLAMAAVLAELEAFARLEGDRSVIGAREDCGATWDEVALATNYANAVTARRRYTPSQREAARVGERERRERARSTAEDEAASPLGSVPDAS